MTRRVHPLVSLNPYQGTWTIKVRLTNKGNLRTYKNNRGEGHVFNVELTDEDVSNTLVSLVTVNDICTIGCSILSKDQFLFCHFYFCDLSEVKYVKII